MTDLPTRRPRVLVLGATGYIGGNILRAFAREPNAEVIAGCRRRERLQSGFEGAVRVGDLRDPAYRETVFDGVDVVCFASAWSALHGSRDASRSLFFEPTILAMTAAAQAGVARILFTSAIDVKNVATSRFRAIREDLAGVWPHLANVMAIEEHLRSLAGEGLVAAAIRCGYFVGPGTALGILPVLLPRLRARVVPFIDGGRAPMRLVDGRDVAEAFRVVATAPGLTGWNAFDVTAGASPTFFECLRLLHAELGYPMPWFSVSYDTAYRFAAFAEALARITPFEPLLTRSIVYLSEAAAVDMAPLGALGFRPTHRWQDSVREQVDEIHSRRIPSRLVDAPAPLLP